MGVATAAELADNTVHPRADGLLVGRHESCHFDKPSSHQVQCLLDRYQYKGGVVGQWSVAHVVQIACPCTTVTRDLLLATCWVDCQRSPTRLTAQRKPNKPHPFLEPSGRPTRCQREWLSSEIVEQLTIHCEFGWAIGGLPDGSRTPIQNAFGWGMAWMGMDGLVWEP